MSKLDGRTLIVFVFIMLFALVAQSTRLLSYHLELTSPLYLFIAVTFPVVFVWRLFNLNEIVLSPLVVPGLLVAGLPLIWFPISYLTYILSTPSSLDLAQFIKGWAIEMALFSSFILFWLSGFRSAATLIVVVLLVCLLGGGIVVLQEFGFLGPLYAKTNHEYLTFRPVAKYQNVFGELKYRNGGISGNWHDAANFISIGFFACLAIVANAVHLKLRVLSAYWPFFWRLQLR